MEGRDAVQASFDREHKPVSTKADSETPNELAADRERIVEAIPFGD
jgi:hypothetical protein